MPIITQAYGKDAFEFWDNAIVVMTTQRLILNEMRNNPNITQIQLMDIARIGKTAIQRNVSFLRKNGYVERVGSNKNGYWRVL